MLPNTRTYYDTYYKAMGHVPKKEEKEEVLYRCPKFQKCVMDCHHRVPHEHDKWCSATHIDELLQNNPECPHCVPELASDCTFFEEDFEIN